MKSIRMVTNTSIFLLQGTLATLFFFSLGSTWWDGALLAALGVILELVKRQSWVEWKSRNGKGHWLASSLV